MKGSKIILAVLVLIFLILGGYLVILSQGLTIDFDDWRIVKTGAVFLSVEPGGAELKIDGESKRIRNATFSIFNNGTLIENLTPEEHLIEISKNGFRGWRKLVQVEPGLVTEFGKIILIAEEIPLTAVNKEKTVDDFWLTAKGVITEPVRGEKIILTDPHSTLVASETRESVYFLADLSDLTSIVNLTELFNSLKQRQLALPGAVPIKELAIHPFSDSKLIIRTNAGLYELDVKRIKLELVSLLKDVITQQVVGTNEILLTDSQGNLFFYNLLFKNKTVKATDLNNIEKIKTNNHNNKIGLLDGDGKLFLYDRSKNGALKKLVEGVKDFYFFPNDRRLLILTAEENIKVLDLEKNKSWLLTLPKGKIKDLTIIPDASDYFLALVDDRLIVSEIYPGEPTNWYLIANEIKKFQLEKNVLYLLKENGELMKTEIGKWR